MKRVLFINPHFPLFSTPTCGGANRTQMFLKALTYVGHVDVVSLWEDEVSNLPNCDVIYSGGLSNFGATDSYGRLEKFIRLLAPWRANNIFPLNKDAEAFADDFIRKNDYDYIAVRYLFTAAEFGLLKYVEKLIVDVDDNPMNTLLVRKQKSRTQWRKAYLACAAISAGIMSKIVLRKVHTSFYSNVLQSPCKQSKYLPNVSVQNKPLFSVNETLPMRAVMVGSWSYYPNKHGLIYFLQKIWPSIIKEIPEACLDVIGRMDDKDLQDLCHKAKGVTARGFVDEIRAEYQNARCTLVPIYYGSGTCVKVVETMCLNRPFVSTPCGVRGLEQRIQAGIDYLLVENDKQFAEATVSLLRDTSRGAELARHAIICADKYFSPKAFNEVVKNSI